MNFLKKAVAAFGLLFFVSEAVASEKSVALNINDDDLEVAMFLESDISRNSKIVYELSGLSAVDEFDNKYSTALVGIENIGLTDLKGIIFGLGFNAHTLYNDDTEDTFSALALRARVGYVLPVMIKTTISGVVNYAPESLCFSGDIEKYTNTKVEAEVDVIDGGRVVVGYRNIVYGLDGGDDYKYNSAVYGGFKLVF